MTDLYWKILVVVIAAAVVGMLARAGLQSRPTHKGWRVVKPGAMHWVGALLAGALCLFLTWIWLFVGSSRADAERQMAILFWLLVAFGIGAIYAGWTIVRINGRAVRWRGQSISFASSDGLQTRAFRDVVGLQPTFSGFAIRFSDGATLLIDPYATGAEALIEALEEFLKQRDGDPGVAR